MVGSKDLHQPSFLVSLRSQLAVQGALLGRLLSLVHKSSRGGLLRLLAASDRMYWKLLKELLIHSLDVQGFLSAAPYAVAYHQACELVAIYEHNSLAQLFGCLTCRG
jgi:hypothetical protein